jgi:hypothetical protein
MSQYQDLYLPLEVDTEFQERHYPFIETKDKQQKTITVQVRGVEENKGITFQHPDMGKDLTMPMFISPFVAFDYMSHMKYKWEEVANSVTDCKILHIDIIGFFLVADIYRIFQDHYLDEMISKLANQKPSQGIIEQKRRLRVYTKERNKKENPYIYLNKYVRIAGQIWQIAVGLIDTSAIQGNINYKTLCANTMVNLTYKDNYTSSQKKYMIQQYEDYREKFIAYGLDDVKNYKAIQGHDRLLQEVYKEIGISEYYNPSRPTIGATVNRLVESSLKKQFNIPNQTSLKELLKYASFDHFIENRSSTSVYLAKTNGGRCRNNRPLDVNAKGLIVDIDIKGCYGNGLKNQEYPIGKPMIISYPRTSKNNGYMSLREFLDVYEQELVPGLWFVRVTNSKELIHEQDYFMSWIPPKNIKDMEGCNEEYEDGLNNDLSKIYTHEIQLGVFQHDDLEWIRNTCTKIQREELLDHLQVVAGAIYPRTLRKESVADVLKENKYHEGKNRCLVKVKKIGSEVIRVERECYAWTSVNMGDLLISKLQEIRDRYPKDHTTKMNQFIKLMVNTVYGDIVSPYFNIGNTIVGNNITARARSMAWYMEKSFNGYQTITDGCCFDLNNVVKGNKKNIHSIVLMNIDQKRRERKIHLGPLGGRKKYRYKTIGDEIIIDGNTKIEIAKKAHDHMKKTFPKVRVIHQFQLEIKEIVTHLVTHGASNYQTRVGDQVKRTKMRSYKDMKYRGRDGKDLNPVLHFYEQLANEQQYKQRTPVFVESKIIKTSDYKKNEDRYKTIRLLPGNTYSSPRMLRECTLSTYAFKNHCQYRSWLKQASKIKKDFGQSYESYYTNGEGILNYQRMNQDIYHQIKEGYIRYKPVKRVKKMKHLYHEEFIKQKKYIDDKYREFSCLQRRPGVVKK